MEIVVYSYNILQLEYIGIHGRNYGNHYLAMTYTPTFSRLQRSALQRQWQHTVITKSEPDSSKLPKHISDLQMLYVVSWLVARFAIVPQKKNIQGSDNFWKVHCCGKKSWETIFLNKMFEWKNIAFFLEKSCLSVVPKKSQIAY